MNQTRTAPVVSEEFDPAGDVPSSHLWDSIWRRKSLLLLGIVVCLGAGALHYSRLKPVYESRAAVLVVKKQADTGMPQGSYAAAYVEDYVSAHATLIKSPLIVERALNPPEEDGKANVEGDREASVEPDSEPNVEPSSEGQINLAALPSIAGSADPVGRIIRSLSVERENNGAPAGSSNILNLTYRGSDPAECRIVLASIIASYKGYLDDTFATVNSDTLDALTDKSEVLEDQLTELEDEYLTFRKDHPLLPTAADRESFLNTRLAGIESEMSSLRIRGAEINARLETIKTARETEDPAVVRAMLAEWRKDFDPETGHPAASLRTAATLEETLLPLRIREKNLLERYGRKHPEVQAVSIEIEMTRDLYQRAAAEASSLTPPADNPQSRPDPVAIFIRSLEQQLVELQASEKALGDMLAQEREDAKTLTDAAFEGATLRDRIARIQKYHDALLTQMEGIDLGQDLGGYTTSVIAPPADGQRVEPNLSRTLTIAGVLGMLLGLGLVWLAEVTDKSFRNPDEIQRRLGLPVIGHIPLMKIDRKALQAAGTNGAALEPTLMSLSRPKSLEAEAFRGLRTSLYFSARGGHKVIQVTSPESGDGKTTVAANLAVSIAQSGKRVLLVDCDFRKPRQHKIFAVPNHAGLASVIADNIDPQDAIHETVVPGLSLLPCGPQPPNPAELLTSPRFEELLHVLREQFDFVVVDSPPLLAVSDPSIIAARVDGVILALRVTKHGRPKAERAKETLETMGATISGVVVNGLDPQSGGYGYGYGSGYGYGYGGYGATHEDNGASGDDADPPGNGWSSSPLRTPGAPARS